ALWTILCHGRRGETYNIGGESESPNLAIVHKLIELAALELGSDPASLEKLVTFVKDRPGHDQRYAVDCSKLRRELHWKPRHSLETGLRQTVRWYRQNSGWVERVRTGAYRDWIEANYGGR
ncbi:MAG TPA: GDP-mannose 4,6-dehydratase, partial [Polyangiaceae bacterium]|nr:GDP-mannose 4,6-dehydratase [Polyangiaceae bacterium]